MKAERNPKPAHQVNSPEADHISDDTAEQTPNDEDVEGVARRLIARHRAAFRVLANRP